jgi:dihydrofolate synthase / folylpolyglutamate synthase
VDARAAREWIAGLEILGMRFGLERMTALLAVLGEPQRTAPALHVVGTNGKTSTTRLAAAALASQGRRVGAYTSPHVLDWRERIAIDGTPLGEAGFAAAASAVREAAEGLDLPEGDAVTQFEALTAMGFHAFRAAGCDALAIEAGLGGRYDATNVLRPGAAVILTNVALEHTELLGDTEAAIAGEKLAVVTDGSDRLVVGPLSPPADEAVRAECARRGLRPVRYEEGLVAREAADGVEVRTPRARYTGIPLGLHGTFQRENLAVALAGAEMVLEGALEDTALAAAVAAVAMPGRLELVPGAPDVLLDGAHNPAGMGAMVASLPDLVARRRPAVAVVSVLADKDAAAMLRSLGAVVDGLIATRSSHPRAVAAAELAATAAREGVAARAIEGPAAALAAAREQAGPGGTVVVAGSLYLLADLRPLVVPGGGEPPARLARARKGIDPDEAK